MDWTDILKDEPPTRDFIDEFKNKPHSKDKQPIVRDAAGKKLSDEDRAVKLELVNWFKTFISNTFETMLDNVTATEPIEGDAGDGSGMKFTSEPIAATNIVKKLGLEITDSVIDEMLQAYLDTIITSDFDDSEKNKKAILSTSGYNKILQVGYKFIEELFSGIFDDSLVLAQTQLDIAADKVGEEGNLDIDPTKSLPSDIQQALWEIQNNGDAVNISIQDNILNIKDSVEDIIDPSDFGEDSFEDNLVPELKNNVTASLKKYFQKELNTTIKDFTTHTFFVFLVKLGKVGENLESNELVSDQVTEEESEEMRNRPELQARELNEEERQQFEEEFKSNDKYTGEFDWQSILYKEIGLTTNAGFTPAIHNITYGKKPCKSCKNKKTSCGCE